MKYFTAIAAAVLLAASAYQPTVSIAQDATLPPIATHILSQPAVSPDGLTIAFVHDGDIWSVPAAGGTARRLTVTEDNDGDPQFSPDGKWLAFRSRRYGSDDVFVMPAEGGVAKRLTFADASDQPDCWLPDSSGIIFSSYRRENSRDLWVVRLEGGEPWPITGGGFGVHEYDATITSDGKQIAYVNSGGSPFRRRGYNGHADSDIWLCDFDGVKTTNHRRITENNSHDVSPTFSGSDVLYFIGFAGKDLASERTGQIVSYLMKDKRISRGEQQALDAKDISIGGGSMAIATGSYGGWQLRLWTMMSSHPFRIVTPEIKLNTDVRRADTKVNTLTTASDYVLSPDGKKLAFVAGGDVFVMPVDDDAIPMQLTDTVKEECGINWSPSSTHLLFNERISGVVKSVDLRTLGEGFGPVVEDLGLSGVSNLHMDAFGRLWGVTDESVLDVLTSGAEWGGKVLSNATTKPISGVFHSWNLGTGYFSVSSDGRWVLFEQSNANYDDHVVLGDSLSGEVTPVSHLFGSASHPRFSADGKRIVFINNQEGDYDVWSIELAPEAPTFREDKLGDLFKKKPSKDKDGEKTDKDAEDDKPGPKPAQTGINVQLEGIKDRIKRITSLDGNETSPLAMSDGKTYFFIGSSQGQSNLWKLVLDPDKGPDMKQLTQSRSSKSGLSLSADEKNLWWLDGGKITSMSVNGGKTNTYNFRVDQRRKREQLRAAAFDEAAWVMGNYFYDRKHHGLDWKKTADRYKQALGAVSTGDEYDGLMDELLGELNSSHQGYTGADVRSDNFSESTGCLGLLFDPVELANNRYKIVEVVKGGPCDLPEGAPKVGEFLFELNGKILDGRVNLSEQLVESTGKKTILEFRPDPFTGDGAHKVAVKPIARRAEYSLYYERWVAQQRAMVDKLSGGRLGYVHIPAMNDPSLRAFKHELGDEMLDKEGVVIDVRYNGGGYTAVHLLEILIKKTWLKRQWGGMDQISENIYRSVALEKPSTLLINQASFSNAEIMAEGFRRLEIGKIVGVDTAGGVIGTGSYSLIDGSRMRLPSSGAYTIDGENLELVGRTPDIFVENNPDELDQGIDRQTETAVKQLLKQIDGK